MNACSMRDFASLSKGDAIAVHLPDAKASALSFRFNRIRGDVIHGEFMERSGKWGKTNAWFRDKGAPHGHALHLEGPLTGVDSDYRGGSCYLDAVPANHRERPQPANMGETRWIALDAVDTTLVWQMSQRFKSEGMAVDTTDFLTQKHSGMEIFNASLSVSKGDVRCVITVSRHTTARHPSRADGVYYQAKVMNHSSRPDFFGGTCSLLVPGLPSAENACALARAEFERLLESGGASTDTWR